MEVESSLKNLSSDTQKQLIKVLNILNPQFELGATEASANQDGSIDQLWAFDFLYREGILIYPPSGLVVRETREDPSLLILDAAKGPNYNAAYTYLMRSSQPILSYNLVKDANLLLIQFPDGTRVQIKKLTPGLPLEQLMEYLVNKGPNRIVSLDELETVGKIVIRNISEKLRGAGFTPLKGNFIPTWTRNTAKVVVELEVGSKDIEGIITNMIAENRRISQKSTKSK